MYIHTYVKPRGRFVEQHKSAGGGMEGAKIAKDRQKYSNQHS